MTTPLFNPIVLGGIRLNNRIIRSATHEGLADERGWPTQALVQKYIHLAKGGAGAIITGYAGIQADGKSTGLNMNMMDDDEAIAKYRAVTDAVHACQTPIILQLAHCGRQTRSKKTGFPTVAPSAIRDNYSGEKPMTLSEAGINTIIDNFVQAIDRAKQAGFDGVQLHAAHGYLLAQFLSAYSNHRKDRWGGSLENRFRILKEIISLARDRVDDFPIWVKLNAYDHRPGGMRVDKAVQIAQLLEASGVQALEISSGTFEENLSSIRNAVLPTEAVYKYVLHMGQVPRWLKFLLYPFVYAKIKPILPLENYNVSAAAQIKAGVSIPVIVVGGIKRLEDITRIISDRSADAVSLCRPFIIEPNIVKKFQAGQQATKCIYCSICAIAFEVNSLRCYHGKTPAA